MIILTKYKTFKDIYFSFKSRKIISYFSRVYLTIETDSEIISTNWTGIGK